MTPEEFAEFLAPGYEGRGYEFKGAGSRSDQLFFARVTRAVLGMTNRSGGGLVFIGVGESPTHEPKPVGLTDEQCASWNYDDTAAGFAPHADPRVMFDREVVAYEAKAFVVLTVHEFDDIPVICRRAYNNAGDTILRDGALYVRSRGKPETSEVPTQTEMREVLDLAIDKGVRSFLARAERVGLQHAAVAGPTDADLFTLERGDPDA